MGERGETGERGEGSERGERCERGEKGALSVCNIFFFISLG